MSAVAQSAGHDASHDQGHGAEHGSRRSYLIGFGLSVILTAIPFWLVMAGVLDSKTGTAIAIIALAVVQIVVHMIFFLHMSTRAEGGWSMMAMLFTLTLVIITLSGSIWVMYHMNANMMPGMEDMTGDASLPDMMPPGTMAAPGEAAGQRP